MSSCVDFWHIDRDELKALGKIAPGDISRILMAAIGEKQKVIQDILLTVLFVLFLASSFYGVLHFDYYNFEWTGLTSGAEISQMLVTNFQEYNLVQLFLMAAPLVDKISGICFGLLSILMIILVVTVKQISEGGSYASLFMVLVWIVMAPLFLLSAHSILLALGIIPISYTLYLYELDINSNAKFWSFFFDNFKTGFFLRIIPFLLMITLLPILFGRITKRY